MNTKIKILVALGLLVLTTTCFGAQTSFRGIYLGGSFTNLKIKDFDERLNGGVLKFGYDINDFLAIEGHAGATISKHYELQDDQGQTVESLDLRTEHAGLYARINWRLTNITLYGLAGYGYYKEVWDVYSAIQSIDETVDFDEDGLSFGVGLDLFGSARTALSVNWMQLISEKDDYDIETNVQAIYLGITYYFNPQKTTHFPN